MRNDAHLVSVLRVSRLRLFKLLFCISLILTFTAYPVGAAQNRAAGDIIYVDSTATGAGDGTSWENAYPSLMSALAAAQTGETLYVAEGTYRPGSGRAATFSIPSTAKLYGGFPTGGAPFENRNPSDLPTILSGDVGLVGVTADNAYHVVTVTSAALGTLIDGFIIQGGNSDAAAENAGGGMRITGSAVTVVDTVVKDNRALSGAGIYVTGSDATFTHVSVHNNVSAYDDTGSKGGGMAAENNLAVTITGSDVSGNQALYGAGIYLLAGNSLILRTEVHDNQAAGTASHPGSGGGVYAAGPVTILSSQVYANTAACGDGNASGASGAGVYSAGAQTYFYNSILWVNQFSEGCTGSGAGIYAAQNVSIRSSTLVHNAGAAVYAAGSQVILSNDIVWANTLYDSAGGLQVTYSLVEGGYSGTGNLSADPRFVNEIDGNYRIGPASPAIDAGDNSAVPADSADLDGDGNLTEPLPVDFDQQARFFDMPTRANSGTGSAPFVDMGAFEVRNTAPVLPGASTLALPDLPRNTLDPTGTQVSDLLADLPAPGITDIDLEGTPGIAIIAADNTHGSWQYATPGATDYTDIGTVSEASALLLAADSGDRLRFVPVAGYIGTISPGLTFRAWDQMDGYTDGQTGVNLLGNGGAWPYSVATGTVSVNVLDVNTSPTLDPITNRTVLEGSGTIVVNLTGISPGLGDDGQALAVTATSSNPAFLADPTVAYISPAATGTLSMTPGPKAYGEADITVSVRDDGGTANGGNDTVTRTFHVSVALINDAPSLVIGSSPTVLEDSGVQVISAWASQISAGPGESSQTLTVTLTPDRPSLFSSGPAVNLVNGTLTFTPAPNASGVGTITLVLRDNGGTANAGIDQVTATFTITITPVNDPPAISSFTASGPRGKPISFSAQDFASHYSDADTDPLSSIQILSLPTAGRLALNGTTVSTNQVIPQNQLSALVYVPAGSWYGTTTFGWTASDGELSAAQPATVTLNLAYSLMRSYAPLVQSAPTTWKTLLSENFEGGFPSNWDLASYLYTSGRYSEITDQVSWGKRNCHAATGQFGGWAVGGGSQGGAAGCMVSYPNNVETWMVQGPFDLSQVKDGMMQAKIWVDVEAGYDVSGWGVSIDENTFYGRGISGTSNGWATQTIDLKNVYQIGNVTGQKQVWIGFWFASDSSNYSFEEGSAVDDLVVFTCAVGTVCPGTPFTLPASQGSTADRPASRIRRVNASPMTSDLPKINWP